MADTLWIWILLNILETGIYIALILGMMPDIRSLGKAERLTAILIFALMAVLSGARQRIGSLFSPLAYFYSIFILITGTFLIYRRQLCLIIGTVLTYCSLTMLTVYLTVFFLSAIQTKNAYSGIYRFFGENINESFSVVRGVVLAVSLIIVWRLNHHDVRRQSREYRIVLLAAGIVLSALVLEYQNLLEYGVMYSAADIPAVKAVLRDSMLSMITSLVLLAVLGTLYLKNRRIKDENSMLVLKEEMERQKYEELNTAVNRNRELVHDTKNHYLVISEYVRNKEYEKLNKYLEDIKNDFVRTAPGIYTGNQILDLILSQKRIAAEKKGIPFEMQVMPLSELPFEEREICALFGNLLDNAIEACDRMDDGKVIKIKIEQKNQMLLFEIKNSVNEEPKKKRGSFPTWKKDRSLHGYGLKSVERIVESHEGIISYEMQDKLFTVRVTFFELE